MTKSMDMESPSGFTSLTVKLGIESPQGCPENAHTLSFGGVLGTVLIGDSTTITK